MDSCYLCEAPAGIGPVIEDGNYPLAHRVECPTCLTYSISADAIRHLRVRPRARPVLSDRSRQRFKSGTAFLRIQVETVDDADAEASVLWQPGNSPGGR